MSCDKLLCLHTPCPKKLYIIVKDTSPSSFVSIFGHFSADPTLFLSFGGGCYLPGRASQGLRCCCGCRFLAAATAARDLCRGMFTNKSFSAPRIRVLQRLTSIMGHHHAGTTKVSYRYRHSPILSIIGVSIIEQDL